MKKIQKYSKILTRLFLGIFAFGLFSQGIHLSFYEHYVCFQHGEWIHAEADEPALNRALESSIVEGATHDHFHCPEVCAAGPKKWSLADTYWIDVPSKRDVWAPHTAIATPVFFQSPLIKAPKTSPPVLPA